MLRVVCLNAGDYHGRGVQYVDTLFDMVCRNLPDGFKGDFTCFTDDTLSTYAEGVIVRPHPAPWLKGWWGKLALFDPDLFPKGDRILYLDLSVLITGPLDDIAGYAGNFAIMRDVYRPHGLQSSVMAWASGTHADIWDTYGIAGYPQEDPGGDQAFLEEVVRRCDLWQNLLPGQVTSFKADARFNIPKNARIVVCHGNPKPHEITKGWVPKVWKVGGGTSAEMVTETNVSRETISRNIKSAMLRDVEWLKIRSPDASVALICAGGPSLSDELDSIRIHQAQGGEVVAVNGSFQFLMDRRILPQAHVMCDAREDNLVFVPPLASPTKRFYASQCSPVILDAAGPNLTLWHPFFDDVTDITGKEDKSAYIGGGSTAGLKAVTIAFALGCRKIHLYGFDSSYRDKENHAYVQPLNDGERIVEVELHDGQTFQCAPWMVTQAEDFQHLAEELTAQGCELYVHGTGLIPALASMAINSTAAADYRAKAILKRLEDVPSPKVAEIGVFGGDLSKRLLGRRADLTLLMVDPWTAENTAEFNASEDFHSSLSQQVQDEYCNFADQMTSFAGDRRTIIRDYSVKAATQVEDESLDLVFIDADHSYEGCSSDIEAWYPKVKPGGIISGHDYANNEFRFGPMVKRAVDEAIEAKSLALDLGDNYTWFAVKPRKAA